MKFLYKIRKHLFILLLAAAYLAAAPGVYARFFVKLGKPTDLNLDPPTASPLINFNIENSEESIVVNQKVYQFSGWAFLENFPDQSLFDKFIVLNSKDRVYYFPYENVSRLDVNRYFQDLGLDLSFSGFLAFIAPETVQSGIYNIGFLFYEKSSKDIYYSISNQYFKRSPNTMTVETGNLPDNSMIQVSSFLNNSKEYGIGKQLEPLRFEENQQIQLWIEDSSEMILGEQKYERLEGWAFLNNGINQSEYTRWIVLESKNISLYFPVKSKERPDVPIVYPELNSRFSGFSSDILEESLPLGSYKIQFLFQSRTQDVSYITTTPWSITKTTTGLIVEKK